MKSEIKVADSSSHVHVRRDVTPGWHNPSVAVRGESGDNYDHEEKHAQIRENGEDNDDCFWREEESESAESRHQGDDHDEGVPDGTTEAAAAQKADMRE